MLTYILMKLIVKKCEISNC